MGKTMQQEMACKLILRREWSAGQNPWAMSCHLSSEPESAAMDTDITKGDILKIMDERGVSQIGEVRVDSTENFPRLLSDTLYDYLGNRKPEERFKGSRVTLLRPLSHA